MPVADVNVRIGAEIKELEKALRKTERALTASVAKFADMGNRMSMALTAPLALFGVSAVKAAGEMESMRLAMETTMKAAGYSIQQARDEMEKLRIAALAPGLDFEQAVKGSVRLQNVGFSAEKARTILVQLANAVAMSGGSAQQLDGVTKQFGQMIAKGRILQEDLGIIQENMPGIFKAMELAFGTNSATKLQQMGVTAEQFVNGVTAQLANLPRVEGGISNAITNAGVAIKGFLASVGESLNKTFGISDKLNVFSEKLGGIAQWFGRLDYDTKRTVGTVALLVAGFGPFVKILSITGSMLGTLYMQVQRIAMAFKAIQALGLLSYFNSLNMAMRFTVIGVGIAAVLALSAAFVALRKDTSAAAETARMFESVQKSVIQHTAAERVEAERLAAVLKSEKSTREQKEDALKRLQQLAPDIFKNYKAEKMSIDEVNSTLAEYIRKIEARSRLAALDEILLETQRKLLETQKGLNEETKPSTWQTVGNAVLSLGNMTSFAIRQGQSLIENNKQAITSLEATKNALEGEIAAMKTSTLTKKATTSATAAATDANKTLAKSYADIDKAARLANRAQLEKDVRKDRTFGPAPTISANIALPTNLSSITTKAVKPAFQVFTAFVNPLTTLDQQFDLLTAKAEVFGTTNTLVAEKIKAVETAMTTAIDMGYSPMSTTIERLKNQHATLTAEMAKGEAQMMRMGLAANMIEQIGQSMAASLQDTQASFKSFVQGILGAMAKAISGYIKMAVAAAVQKTVAKSANPLIGLALGAAAGAAVSGLFNRLMASIGIPALAQGGLAYAPTLAMVGDNRNAISDPEVIAPLSKLQNILQPAYGAGELYGTLRADGDQLLVVLEAAKKRQNRRR